MTTSHSDELAAALQAAQTRADLYEETLRDIAHAKLEAEALQEMARAVLDAFADTPTRRELW